MNIFTKLSLIVPAALFASSAMAVPVLQIGPTAGDAGAFYGTCDTGGDPNTWCLGTDAFNIYLLDSPNNLPDVDNNDTVFLAFSAIPKSTNATDVFDISPQDGNGTTLTIAESGLGAPPASDPNDLAPHGIFDTYFEVYALADPTAWTATTVPDTQPGQTGTAPGFVQTINMNVASMVAEGIHVDAFICGEGESLSGCTVRSFAPFSHDATYVPVPPAVWLFGSGLLGLVGIARRKKV